MHFCRRCGSFWMPYQLTVMLRKRSFTLSSSLKRSGQIFFELRKQVVDTGCHVQTIRWVGDDVLFKLLQESDGRTGDVGASVVAKARLSFWVSHYTCQWGAMKSINNTSFRSRKLCLFGFLQLGRRGMPLFTWLLLGLRYKVKRPGFVTSDNQIQKVVLFICMALKKFIEKVNALPLVVLCKHSQEPYCAHLPLFQLFSESFLNGAAKNLKTKMQRSSRAIIRPSSMIYYYNIFSLWISIRSAVNSLHYFHKITK